MLRPGPERFQVRRTTLFPASIVMEDWRYTTTSRTRNETAGCQERKLDQEYTGSET